MTPEEKLAQAKCRVTQTLNEITAEFGAVAEDVGVRPTYENIAARLTNVEAELAILNEKLAPQPQNTNEA